MSTNRSWLLGASNEGEGVVGMSLSREHFCAGELAMPKVGEGDVLIESQYFATDPMNHAWARGVPGRFEAIEVGNPLRGGVAGKVVESRHPDFPEGAVVAGFLPWSDFNVCDGNDVLDMPLYTVPADLDPAHGLSALGMTGICAYLSLIDFGRFEPGDTVAVSGASGAIGSLTCQLAQSFGAKVVGLARGVDKCEFVKGLGSEVAIDITTDDWVQTLAKGADAGIDVFVDNVGGVVLDTVLTRMNRGGRIVICGATAHYQAGASISNHLMLAISGLTMSGFFYFDMAHRWQHARDRLAECLRRGAITDVLDIAEGFDQVPDAALGQFQGANFGRKLIRIN
jgi:NADPH-dependent curcumin reductase CurA